MTLLQEPRRCALCRAVASWLAHFRGETIPFCSTHAALLDGEVVVTPVEATLRSEA